MANDFTTGFSDVVNPQPQQPSVDQVQQMIRPPASPEEYQQRLSGWADFGKAIRENPALQLTLARFAANMLQGRQPGQSTASAVAEGAFGAMEYGGKALLSQQKNQQEQERHQAELARTQAATASSEAQTAATKQQTAFSAARQPGVMESDQVTLATQKLRLAEEQYNQAVRDQVPAKERAQTERAVRIAQQNLVAAQALHQEQAALLAKAQANALNSGFTKNGALPGGARGKGETQPDIRKKVLRIPLGNGYTEIQTLQKDGTTASVVEYSQPPLTGIDAMQQAAAMVQASGVDPQSKEGRKLIAQQMLELAKPQMRRFQRDPVTNRLIPMQEPQGQQAAPAVKQRVWDAKTKQWVE